MGVLVNGALGALSAVVGSLLAHLSLGARFAAPAALLLGLVGFFAAGQVFAESAAVATGSTQREPKRRVPKSVAQAANAVSNVVEEEFEDAAAAAKAIKKAKKLAAERAKKEAAEALKAAEAAAKLAAKKLAAKKAKKTPVVESSSESESEPEPEPQSEEEEVASAPKSKSAIKKAKAKAKELAAKAEAAAAAKAAEKAAKKSAKAEAAPKAAAAGAKSPAAAQTAAEKKAAAAAAAAAAADLEGWETIEATKPTKSQAAKAAASASAPAAAPRKKGESIPSSERELTEDIIVPIKSHAQIVGTKGARLHTLMSASGAVIDMPKADSGSSKIRITGTPAQVASARNAIESIVERGFSSLTEPGVLSDDLSIDPKDVGLVLGANGATLRTIQTKTGTRINLPEKGSNGKKLTIVGEKDGVRAAKAALRSLLADGYSELTHEGWVKAEVAFPADKFGVLIGPKGQNIKSIQGNTKTRINLPDRGANKSVVTVVGLPAGVAQAEKEIARLLERELAPPPEALVEDLREDDAWGQEHTAQGEDALWE